VIDTIVRRFESPPDRLTVIEAPQTTRG